MQSKKKLALTLAVVFILNIIIIYLVQCLTPASASPYKKAPSVSETARIQPKSELTSDKPSGTDTPGEPKTPVPTARTNDIALLARLISAEAKGEPYRGQVAVGAVALNRMKNPSFPNTLAGVVYQQGAFTSLSDGRFDKPVSDNAYAAARDALAGSDPTGGALYYFNPSASEDLWLLPRPLLLVIGKLSFCA